MEERLLTYTIHNNKLVNVIDVPNGLACACTCPKCSEPLVAKNNPANKKVPHFAHRSSSNCIGAYETALHIMAKEILMETKKMRTPDFHHDYDANNKKSKFKDGQLIEFDNIILEKSPHPNSLIVADAIAEIKDRQLVIEFAKTHFIDSKKKEKLSKQGIHCIEIDLANQTLDKEALKELLVSTSDKIYWICNPKLEKQYSIYKENEKIEAVNAKQEREHKATLASEKRYASIQELEKKHRKKYNDYRSNYDYKFLSFIDGVAQHCPLTKNELQKLRITAFYNQPVLRRIIDGEFWNAEIYGNYNTGTHIYLAKEKILIYPLNSIDEEKKMSNLFFAGLKEIAKILKNGGTCNNCSHRIDWLAFDDRHLTVCNYKSIE